MNAIKNKNIDFVRLAYIVMNAKETKEQRQIKVSALAESLKRSKLRVK